MRERTLPLEYVALGRHIGKHRGVDAGEVAELLRRVAGWEDATPAVAALPGGITNQNFRAEIDGQAYVVRIPGANTELLGVDHDREAEVVALAADLGIGPPVVTGLPGYPTLITRFVAGSHASSASEFTASPRLEAVVAAIRLLHGVAPVKGRFPIHRVVEHHARDAADRGVTVPRAFDELHRLSSAIETAFAAAPRPDVLCHNDLLPANVLFDHDRVWLLDYEYAGMNDVSFDLANLSVNAGMTPDDDERLLTAYDGAVTDSGWARLQLMKVLSELREGMWAVVQQAISTLEGFDYEGYAADRLANAQRLGARPETGRWLADAAS